MSSPSALFPSGQPVQPGAPGPSGQPGRLAAISEHPRRRGRYRVRLEDGRTFLVGAEQVSGLSSLATGTTLDHDQVAALELGQRYVACLDRALGALARARRSRRELAQRLRRHEPDAALVDGVLDRLETLGVLDDAAVAAAETAARFRRGEGRARVRQALVRKGIDRRLVDEAIRDIGVADAVDEGATCLAAAEKRARALRGLAPLVQRRRLTAFLARRGFGGALVHEVVRRVLHEVASTDD